MGNLILPKDMNIKNNPIEIATDYSGNTIVLKLGDDVNESLYFYGTFYKKPTNTYIGLDINKYIKDLTNYNDFDISNTDTYAYQLQNFTKQFYYYFYDLNNNLILSGNTYICNQNLKYEDWLKYIINESFGKWNEYKNTLTTDWSLPSMIDDYITNDFIYTYNNFNDNVFKRYWNKSLIGAPINIQMFNNSINDFDGTMTYSYYNDQYSNSSYTTSSLPFTFNNKKAYNLYFEKPISFNDKKYISINLLLNPSIPIIGLNTTTGVSGTTSILNTGGNTIVGWSNVTQYGMQYTTGTTWTTIQYGTTLTSDSFNVDITGLTSNTTYSYRSYIVYSGVTYYGATKTIFIDYTYTVIFNETFDNWNDIVPVVPTPPSNWDFIWPTGGTYARTTSTNNIQWILQMAASNHSQEVGTNLRINETTNGIEFYKRGTYNALVAIYNFGESFSGVFDIEVKASNCYNLSTYPFILTARNGYGQDVRLYYIYGNGTYNFSLIDTDFSLIRMLITQDDALDQNITLEYIKITKKE